MGAAFGASLAHGGYSYGTPPAQIQSDILAMYGPSGVGSAPVLPGASAASGTTGAAGGSPGGSPVSQPAPAATAANTAARRGGATAGGAGGAPGFPGLVTQASDAPRSLLG